MRNLLFFFIICFLGVTVAAAQDTPHPTNEAIFTGFLNTSVDSLLKVAKINPVDTLVLGIEVSNSELQTFIHRKLVEELWQKGFKKLFERKAQNFVQSGFVFRYQLLNWEIQYQPISSGWLRCQWTRRNIRLQQGIILQQSKTGEVVWAGELNYQFQDQIRQKDIAEVENICLRFTKGKFLGDFHDLKKWAEVLFLLGISATTVYLFFSVRSQ